MYLTGKGKEPEINHVVLRKAANSDAKEIKRQDDIYFKDDEIESQMEEDIENEEIITLPEDEEKRGFITYIAMVGNDSVGKVKLELQEGAGGVYGLGVLPEHRRKGYGREILILAVKKLKENNAKSIMLSGSR